MLNLNGIRNIHDDFTPPERPVFAEFNVNNKVVALFDDLEHHAVSFIEGHDAILGCMAWLTNRAVLDALADVENVSIVVQKEDFLRPDAGGLNRGDLWLRYNKLKTLHEKYCFPHIGRLNACGDPEVEAVRCMGVLDKSSRTTPKMHHKFLVGGYFQLKEVTEDDGYQYEFFEFVPQSVWTGSFNMTYNGTNSRENAVVISDAAVAGFYADEWAQIYSLSEPLDWNSTWIEPEFRWGT